MLARLRDVRARPAICAIARPAALFPAPSCRARPPPSNSARARSSLSRRRPAAGPTCHWVRCGSAHLPHCSHVPSRRAGSRPRRCTVGGAHWCPASSSSTCPHRLKTKTAAACPAPRPASPQPARRDVRARRRRHLHTRRAHAFPASMSPSPSLLHASGRALVHVCSPLVALRQNRCALAEQTPEPRGVRASFSPTSHRSSTRPLAVLVCVGFAATSACHATVEPLRSLAAVLP
jgi:hypothetical protein